MKDLKRIIGDMLACRIYQVYLGQKDFGKQPLPVHERLQGSADLFSIIKHKKTTF